MCQFQVLPGSRSVERFCSPAFFVYLTFLSVFLSVCRGADEKPFGIERRIPWNDSRVIGRPEPPPPYTVLKTFDQIEWKAPLYIAPEPSSDRLLVVEQGGERSKPSRVYRISNDRNTTERETFFELHGRLIYGLTFHPKFETNGFLYVFSNGPTGRPDRTNRVSRLRVDRSPPYRCDPESETIILEWASAGHDGGDLAFGRDGMLYITSGDGTSDSDGWVSGQDVSNLLAALLRIDVDHPASDLQYAIPSDNPFVGVSGARPEIWAYGFRNPWRMTVDRETGAVWVGNNGQDLWETAHRVNPGDNYGWSVYEGSHPFYLNRRRGPTPVTPPTIEHSHATFRSLTGGVVYHSSKFPDLNGVYVYGDYATGKIWGARHDGTKLTWHKELADTALKIAAFAVDQNGEILVVDHGDAIYRLVPSPEDDSWKKFPTRLSDTGLFVSIRTHQLHPGLIPYSVNAPGWADGAVSERFIGLPGETKIGYASDGGWNFPDGTVLVQTLSLDVERGDQVSKRRIETRILSKQQAEWVGYSYRWNDEQDEARLVAADGEDIELMAADSGAPEGVRKQSWRIPSRTECMVCHSRAVNFVLGVTELQMNRTQNYEPMTDNQLRTLDHIGVFTERLRKKPEDMRRLVNPYDSTADLEARARSFLHANCSVCHVEAGGGNSQMELRFTTARRRMNLFESRPQHDTFGIFNAMLIAPGDPDRSVLVQRISRRGRGQMPPLVTTEVDRAAVQLFRDWIAQLTPEKQFVREWRSEDLALWIDQTATGRSFDSGKRAFRETGCVQCHRFAGEGGSVGPDLTGVGVRLKPLELLEAVLQPSKTIAQGYEVVEIETMDGDVVSGRLEREDTDVIVLSPPVATAQPVEIRKSDIRSRRVSTVSNMPEGILNVLEQEHVLDLLAYLLSDGMADAAAFRQP